MKPRSVNKILLFCLLAFLVASCQRHKPHRKAVRLNIYDFAKYVSWPDSPDFHRHYMPLLSFFDRKKTLSTFDTAIHFEDQGFGAIDNYYDFIVAGHLFSPTQVHAVLFYDVDLRESLPLACLQVYLKVDTGWQKVCEDTIENAWGRVRYKDWNCDGIMDLSYVKNGWHGGGHGPIEWRLWLVDKNGNLTKVKGFDDLDDPKIDSITHHLFTNTVLNHEGLENDEYKFAGNRVILLHKLFTGFDGLPMDTFYRHIKGLKEAKLKPGQQIYVPLYDPEDDF